MICSLLFPYQAVLLPHDGITEINQGKKQKIIIIERKDCLFSTDSYNLHIIIEKIITLKQMIKFYVHQFAHLWKLIFIKIGTISKIDH